MHNFHGKNSIVNPTYIFDTVNPSYDSVKLFSSETVGLFVNVTNTPLVCTYVYVQVG